MLEYMHLLSQLDPESATPARSGFHAHSASHELNGLAHRTQSQANSWEFLLRIDTDKRHENTLLVFLRDSYAVVVNLDPAEILLRRSRHSDVRLHPLWNELDRV